jgi:hypothetical protein
VLGLLAYWQVQEEVPSAIFSTPESLKVFKITALVLLDLSVSAVAHGRAAKAE